MTRAIHAHYDPQTHEVVDIRRCVVLGHVVRRARVAAGTGVKCDRGTLVEGTRKHFWTAVPLGDKRYRQPWWKPGDGASIGTRFKTQEDATDALVLYTQEFEDGLAVEWRAARKARWGF